MRKVTVKGKSYVSAPLSIDDVAPGILLVGLFSRRAMRVVCLDGQDAILRNLRHPDLLEAEAIEKLAEHYERIVPLAEGGANA